MTLMMSALLTAQPATAEQSRSAVILARGGAGSGTAQSSDPMSGMEMGTAQSSDPMSGMDMGGTGSPASMPGMDMGGSSGSMSGMDMSGTGSSGSMPGMNMDGPAGTSGSASSHPRGLLFGGFAAVNGAVLLGAARLRRRTKTARPRRAATSG